jgi:hypothetical protein
MNFFRNFFLGFGITLMITKLIGFRSVWNGMVRVFIFIALFVVFRMILQVIHIIFFQ